MNTPPLYMLHLPVDARRLARFAHTYGLADGRAAEDTGYHLHALFAALFADAAPRPFAVAGRGGPGPGNGISACLPVLAYSAVPLEALRETAERTATPAAWAAVVWDAAAAKPMPTRFPAGLVLGFEVRACPVVRLARGAGGRADAHCNRPGQEVDAYLAARARADGAEIDRQEVYRDWLRGQIARSNGAALLSVDVTALRSGRVFRRGLAAENGKDGAEAGGGDRGRAGTADGGERTAEKKRVPRAFDRPDVTFAGQVEVTESEGFAAWLARGVGRHRAFGFGMVLLRAG